MKRGRPQNGRRGKNVFLFATMVGIVRQNGRNARRRVFFLGSLNGAGRSSEAEPSGARRRDEERVEGREAGQRPGTRAGVMHSLSSCPKGAKNTRGAGRAKEHSITSITRSDNKVLVRGQYWCIVRRSCTTPPAGIACAFIGPPALPIRATRPAPVTPTGRLSLLNVL